MTICIDSLVCHRPCFIGLIVGAIARVFVPGPTPMGILGTIGAGIAGAFVGGFIGRLLFGPNLSNGWSFVLSVLVAGGVVWLVSGRSRTYRYGHEPDTLVYDRGTTTGWSLTTAVRTGPLPDAAPVLLTER